MPKTKVTRCLVLELSEGDMVEGYGEIKAIGKKEVSAADEPHRFHRVVTFDDDWEVKFPVPGAVDLIDLQSIVDKIGVVADEAPEPAEVNDLPHTHTDRGFKHYEPVETLYGHQVKVYESSAASQPCIWLGIVLTPEMAEGKSNIPPEEATAHMSLEQAQLVHDQLGALIATHYQVS